MKKDRLEAFTGGVVAIIITIMVLEMKPPHVADSAALLLVLPAFLSYVVSFANVGSHWNNHHNVFEAVTQARGAGDHSRFCSRTGGRPLGQL